MANQVIYKNVGIEDEATYGSSTAGTASRIRVTSVDLNLDPTKEVVEDTTTSVKGRDRIINTKEVIEGDISGFGTPRNLSHMFELANGAVGVSVGLGGSALSKIMTFNQNTNGTMLSKKLQVDRSNTQEAYTGVVGTELSLSASDGIMEFTLSSLAKTRAAGTALADNVVGETVKPFNFADFTLTVVAGDTYTGTSAVTLKASEWDLAYANGTEGTHLSGSKTIDRVDPKIPTLEGKISIFHEGPTWVNSAFGSSEYYLRIEGALDPASGLINGETPFLLRIDIPRIQMMTNVRNYEQDEFGMEEIEFNALFTQVGPS